MCGGTLDPKKNLRRLDFAVVRNFLNGVGEALVKKQKTANQSRSRFGHV